MVMMTMIDTLPPKHCLYEKCGVEIVKNQYCVETPAQYEARLATQFCRRKCARLHGPAKKDRPKPTLSPVSVNYGRGGGVEQVKELTPRSEPYKAFIRSLPCTLQGMFCQCNGDVAPHHTDGGGMSLKGSDFSCVPLCHAHHLLMDNAGKKGRGIWSRQELEKIITRLNERFNWLQRYKEQRP
jgi:hypothetical protein